MPIRKASLRRAATLLTLSAIAVGLTTLMGGCPPQQNGTTDITARAVASGLTSPVGMAFPNDNTGRLFIIDQIGLIRVLGSDGTLLSTPFLDLRSRLVPLNLTYDERGLLGLVFHPNDSTNGRFFVFYSAPKGPNVPANFDSEVRISEFHVSMNNPNLADANSESVLLSIPKPQYNHNGGQLLFGPDGFLYITVGDGGAGNDSGVGHTPGLGNGQDKRLLLGKVLRINVDNGDPYGIPLDNPFLTDPNAAREIWAFGLRNPWRASFDRGGTRRLFVADAGQDLFEEVHIVGKGDNLGWRIREGDVCFDPEDAGTAPPTCPSVGADGEPLVDPIIQYEHTDALSRPVGSVVIGGYVYRGSQIPQLVGQYIFGDYSTSLAVADGRIFAATETNGIWTRRELGLAGTEDGRLGRLILAFGEDAAGELYVLTTENLGPVGNTGVVFKIEPAP